MANVNLLTDVHIPDDTKLTFGDSSSPDIEIYYDSAGTDTGKYISGPAAGTFYIQNEATSDVRIRCQGNSGGASKSTLFVQSTGFAFSSDSVTTVQMDTEGLRFPDTTTSIIKDGTGTSDKLFFKYKDTQASPNTTTTTAEMYRDKFKFLKDIELDADLIDINGNTGSAGQVLSSLGTGNGVDWVTPSSSSGTVESVAITVGAGLDVSGSPITTTGTIDIDLDLTEIQLGLGLDSTTTGLSLDLSEFSDMTGDMIGTDEFIVLDNSTERRKAANEIGLSIFDNDAGFTTNTGTVTGTGTAGRVAFWNSGSGITSDPDLTFDNINLTCGGVYLASTGTKGDPSYTFTGDSNTGMFQDGADVLGFTVGGDVQLRVSGSGVGVSTDIYHHGDSDTKISFNTNTITFTAGNTEAFTINASGDTDFPDNRVITFGAGDDLQIYSDGTDGYIQGTTDDLIITANDDVLIKTQSSENAINCVGNGKVSLYYNNSERWETLSDGAGTDGDIIETISNGGGKRIGFNVGDSFTFNSNTIAHYGMSNAGNETDNTGGIVLSGYFGLRFATNGTMRAMIKSNGDTALLSHTLVSGFDENNSSTSYYYIPLAGSITEGTSSQYYRTFACPQAGRVVSIMMMHTSGTAVSLNTYTTQLRVIKNGSTAATSSELSASNGNTDGSYIEYTPDVDFNKGDRLGFQFSKSNTSMRWRGTSATIMIELDDYNL
tara:strand:- start:1175 stop:3319 length:2145 start_codon:yes stop_codon:yes gene_type:complete